ncbi:MAG: hypothetical protein ACNA7Q_04890, partial [Rhodobacterales bacterium]
MGGGPVKGMWTPGGKARALGVSHGIIDKGQQTGLIETALGLGALVLGALVAAGPDRDISAKAAQEAIRHMLTER